MVLNLLRVEEINPEYMLERSFFQFQNQSSIPNLYNDVKQIQTELDSFHIDEEYSISSYYNIREQLDKFSQEYRGYITKQENLLPFLQPGRLIKIENENYSFDWGIVVNFKRQCNNIRNPLKSETVIVIDTLLHINDDFVKGELPKPCQPGKSGLCEVIPIVSTLISQISSIRVYLPNNLRPVDSRKSVLKALQEIKKRYPDGPPILNPVTEMNIKDASFKQLISTIEQYEKRLYSHPLHKTPTLKEEYDRYLEKLKIVKNLKAAKDKLKEARSLLQMDELKHRKRILRRMDYCTAADVIEFKGRVACELSSADELLMTEMIFNGVFNNMSTGQAVALLSCFVCDEKSTETPAATEELSGPLRTMQDLAKRIAKISNECKLELDEESYIEKFKPYLMDVVLHWCKGSSFLSICKMTDIFEGSIIRCMRRLEELLRQMCQAAKTIGDTDLENKFAEGIRLLKRDIVFAASLYL